MGARRGTWIAGVFAGAWLLGAASVHAGVPECGNLRLEDARGCELRGDVDCTASCDKLGVFEKACATELQTVCSRECTLSADAGCTDECTDVCTDSCERGENVICIHNCFGECTTHCDETCADADAPDHCYASCEANCDLECDNRCKPLVDGDCYEHCVECCGGSCTATANLDCQVSCQEEEFERCEYELQVDCDASCDVSGAIFCDGEFVLAGSEVPRCATALAKAGIARIDVDVSADALADLSDGVASADGGAAIGCNAGQGSPRFGWAWLVWVAAVAFALTRSGRGARRG